MLKPRGEHIIFVIWCMEYLSIEIRVKYFHVTFPSYWVVKLRFQTWNKNNEVRRPQRGEMFEGKLSTWDFVGDRSWLRSSCETRGRWREVQGEAPCGVLWNFQPCNTPKEKILLFERRFRSYRRLSMIIYKRFVFRESLSFFFSILKDNHLRCTCSINFVDQAHLYLLKGSQF